MPVEETKNGEGREHRGNYSDDDDEDIFVNPDDGLHVQALEDENSARHRLQMQILEGNLEGIDLDEVIDDEDFPTNLIVTGLSQEFFEDDLLKKRFEGLFQLYGDEAAFHYFRSFKRVRVTYTSATSAIQARIKMHMSVLGDNTLKCFFGQCAVKQKDKDGLLHPPTPDKQFLISPPASPPVDWEPRPESHPTVNYDLISALAKLSPGEPHELHKSEVESHPSIVVHIVADEEILEEDKNKPRLRIMPTKRPEN